MSKLASLSAQMDNENVPDDPSTDPSLITDLANRAMEDELAAFHPVKLRFTSSSSSWWRRWQITKGLDPARSAVGPNLPSSLRCNVCLTGAQQVCERLRAEGAAQEAKGMVQKAVGGSKFAVKDRRRDQQEPLGSWPLSDQAAVTR